MQVLFVTNSVKLLAISATKYHPKNRAAITKIYADFVESEYCKIYPNVEFIYREYAVMQPLQRSYAITQERMPEAVIPGFFSINAANEIAHSIKEFFPISSTPLQEALSAATQAMVPAWLETIAQAKAKLEILIEEIKVEREKLFVEYTLLKEKVSKSEQLKSLTQQISNDRKLLARRSRHARAKQRNHYSANSCNDDALLNSQAAFYEAYNLSIRGRFSD